MRSQIVQIKRHVTRHIIKSNDSIALVWEVAFELHLLSPSDFNSTIVVNMSSYWSMTEDTGYCMHHAETSGCQIISAGVFYGDGIMPKPHTHAKRVLLMHNDSRKQKTCFTHAQRLTHTGSVWFANTKHHSQNNAFCFRNKYIMFYTYKETYFFNYKKISSKYKLKSLKNKLKSFK